MPFSTMRLRPGVNTTATSVLNEAGISKSNLIRFKDGLVQKLGGWTAYYEFILGGVPRALHAWQDLNDAGRLAVGTTENLTIITSGTSDDITPQTLTSDFTPDFDTTNGSTNVTVNDPNISNVTNYDTVYFRTPISVGGIVLHGVYPIDLRLSTTEYRIVVSDAATADVTAGGAVPEFDTTSGSEFVTVTLADHGLSVGDRISLPVATTVGGVTIQGTYTVTEVSSADAFRIAINAAASSTANGDMNAGDCQIAYYITLGPGTASTGYGIGTYGSGGYGTGTSPTAQTGTPIAASDWSLDNWGEINLSCPASGGLYYWRPNGGFENAYLIYQAPLLNGGMFVSMPERILVAWGCSETLPIGIDQDPLLISWSDQEDFFNWTVTTTSQAGSYRIPVGSRIVGALQGPRKNFIWTDLDLWSMDYIGPPLVYGFNKIGSSCGLASRHAATQLAGNIYWMGQSNFFALSGGGVVPLPCPVWDVVFQDLDRDNIEKVRAGGNTDFHEVWWHFPRASTGTGENDFYVKLNTLTGVWDYGPLERSAWIDRSVLGGPIAATPGGLLLQHEDGFDANNAPINAWFETGDYALSEGEDIIFVDWLQPDMKWGPFNGDQDASIQITIKSRMYPGDSPVVHGPYTVTQSTQFINPRVRGRLISMRIESNDVGSFWRMGGIRYRWAPDGRL